MAGRGRPRKPVDEVLDVQASVWMQRSERDVAVVAAKALGTSVGAEARRALAALVRRAVREGLIERDGEGWRATRRETAGGG